MSGLGRRGFLRSLLVAPAALPLIAKSEANPAEDAYRKLAAELPIDKQMGTVMPSGGLYCCSSALAGPGIVIRDRWPE